MANPWGAAQQVVGLLDGRWTVALLALLQGSGRRYQELDDTLDGVSHKVLTETLRRAERDGLVARHLDPSRVETATLYELTDLGRSLGPHLEALDPWAKANWSDELRWSLRSRCRTPLPPADQLSVDSGAA